VAVASPKITLSPEILERIENLQVVARQVAEGALSGMHVSKRHGSSIEFSEHKLYNPGDDIRHVDWRAYAKSDRLHIKRFEDETNLRLELVVDHSASMGFASDTATLQSGVSAAPNSKLAFAQIIAAALGYLSLRQGDAVGLTCFSVQITTNLPPRAHSSHLREVLAQLAQLRPEGETRIVQSMEHVARKQSRASVVVVLSDLFDPSVELLPSLARLVARRHEVNVLHVLDPAELDFPYENPATFQSMEDPRKLFVHPRTLRPTYIEEMKRFVKEKEQRFGATGIHYNLVRTSEDPGKVIAAFLHARQSRYRSGR
jgi:uncharacterized protein (DUF58 family)